MTLNKGRNINSNDTASVTIVSINSVTATVIAAANPDRMSFSVSLAPDLIDVNVAIRYYAASADNLVKGDVLTRVTLGNNNLFKPSHSMDTDNIYTGEISAISVNGVHDLYITEY